MCLIPTYSTLWWRQKCECLLVITVHVFVWVSCPLLAAQSALPKGPFGPASTSLLLGTVGLGLPGQLSLQGSLCCIRGLGSWGPLSPLIRALGHFLSPGLVSRLVFCPSSLSEAPFPETCQFCCPLDISNLPPVCSRPLSTVVTVGLVFAPSSTTCVLELLSENFYSWGLGALIAEKDCTWVSSAEDCAKHSKKKMKSLWGGKYTPHKGTGFLSVLLML